MTIRWNFIYTISISAILISCNQNSVINKQIENNGLKDLSYQHVDVTKELSFSVPYDWKKLDYSDTIKNYTSFRILKNRDSAFFQLSILDTFNLNHYQYIIDLFNHIQEYTSADVDSLYFEEIVLSDPVQIVHYATFRLKLRRHVQRTHLMIIPYKEGLIDIRLVVPQEWNKEIYKHQLSRVAFSLKRNEISLLDKSSEIERVNALHYSQ